MPNMDRMQINPILGYNFPTKRGPESSLPRYKLAIKSLNVPGIATLGSAIVGTHTASAKSNFY